MLVRDGVRLSPNFSPITVQCGSNQFGTDQKRAESIESIAERQRQGHRVAKCERLYRDREYPEVPGLGQDGGSRDLRGGWGG